MRIIDFRLRPPMKSFLKMHMYGNIERSAGMAAGLGMQLSPSAAQKSVDMMFKEMDEVGIQIGVVPGRIVPGLGTSNAIELTRELADVVKQYSKRLVGMAAINPVNRRAAIATIDAAIDMGMKGVVIEPKGVVAEPGGFLTEPMHIDDARLYPIYAHCEDRKVPVLFMAGGNAGPDCTYTHPQHIERVARDFPELKIISGHGNWPWAAEIIHVCYRRPNIYLSPDMYLYNGMPGAMDYINAANGFMADRFLFATAYPLMPLKGVVETFLKFPIKEAVLDRILYKNAADLLGIVQL